MTIKSNKILISVISSLACFHSLYQTSRNVTYSWLVTLSETVNKPYLVMKNSGNVNVIDPDNKDNPAPGFELVYGPGR